LRFAARDVKSSPVESKARLEQQRTNIMRAETESLVEDIKRSLGLLRRHL